MDRITYIHTEGFLLLLLVAIVIFAIIDVMIDCIRDFKQDISVNSIFIITVIVCILFILVQFMK